MNDVEKAIWLHWQPGQHVRAARPELHETHGDPGSGIVTRDPAKLKAYRTWAAVHHDLLKLTLLALASVSTPMNTIMAVTWQSQAVIAQKIGRSDRQLRTILRRLEWADEIETIRCDGRGCYGRHGGTSHYLIYKPVNAPDFDAVAAARTRRRITRTRKERTAS